MIFDTIENLKTYLPLKPAVWEKVIAFINEAMVHTPEVGRHELMGNDLFANVQKYTVKEANLDKLEVHREYVDIQLLLKGSETIYFAPVAGLQVLTDFAPGKDCAMYRLPSLEKSTVLNITRGNWALFWPGEGHIPCCGKDGQEVIKVVVKIKVA